VEHHNRAENLGFSTASPGYRRLSLTFTRLSFGAALLSRRNRATHLFATRGLVRHSNRARNSSSVNPFTKALPTSQWRSSCGVAWTTRSNFRCQN
jgi:hypothetical protein